MDSVNRRQNQWIYAIIVGAINIIIGALLVIYKRDSLSVILIISGVFLVINGTIAILGSIMNKNVAGIVIGAVIFAVGVALIILPNFFTDVFMILLAILLIVMGVSGALSTFSKPDENMLGMVFSIIIAVAMVVAGVYTLFNLQSTADWVMIIIGVIMIVTGALNVLAGILSYVSLKKAS